MTAVASKAAASRLSKPGSGLFVAADVHYLGGGGARAAAVVAAEPTFSELLADRCVLVSRVVHYQPGRFYLRELPALHAVLDDLKGIRLLVIDGYVDLDPDGRPGLGAHAAADFGVPVIGVAKTPFRTATHAIPVVRGDKASRPLYITAAGMSREEAAELVRGMAGPYRMPDGLRRADAVARGRA
ncbi:MAG TPA: endonuclease V [Streptosporangiaceae bacterium]